MARKITVVCLTILVVGVVVIVVRSTLQTGTPSAASPTDRLVAYMEEYARNFTPAEAETLEIVRNDAGRMKLRHARLENEVLFVQLPTHPKAVIRLANGDRTLCVVHPRRPKLVALVYFEPQHDGWSVVKVDSRETPMESPQTKMAPAWVEYQLERFVR